MDSRTPNRQDRLKNYRTPINIQRNNRTPINVQTNYHRSKLTPIQTPNSYHRSNRTIISSSSSSTILRNVDENHFQDMTRIQAFDYIDKFIIDAEIDFNLYQFSKRPIFLTFVRLVSLCFVRIGDKSMIFDPRTTHDDFWRKFNLQFEILSLNIRIHRHDLKMMGQNELSTNNIIKTFAYLIKNRLYPILKTIKELEKLQQKSIQNINPKNEPDSIIEDSELELDEQQLSTIDNDTLKLINENILKQIEIIDNDLAKIDQSILQLKIDNNKKTEEIQTIENELKDIDEQIFLDEKLTVSLQKYENNFENFKIFMQINPLFKQLADVYQNSELISIIKKIPNNPLDNLIRIIQQIQIDGSTNFDENTNKNNKKWIPDYHY
ncbi:hypothetical protein DERP_009060 [Dermatophagoides pteronyssinus]|uniref:Kinetochore protein NDC80 homolog n=1 Tax=Dermatophagoides pteronyssinus TaxID=6956 RepID=A0ABQ8JGA8_DERPT|nr:hypothetical protein DERP_009060 [Dermatophagoides pteronyssinus]